jgi:molybdenum cofactor cytidylyltransferase
VNEHKPQAAAIILAAGASSRLGFPKQLVQLNGETLLARAIRVAAEAGLSPVCVVLPPDRETDFYDPGGSGPAAPVGATVFLVSNPDAAEGMASSIRVGLRAILAVGDPAGVVLLACDQPAVTPAHLAQLACSDGQVFASAYAGRKGVPAYFSASVFEDLEQLQGDRGARDMLQAAPALELQHGELDVDTVEDLERMLHVFSEDR